MQLDTCGKQVLQLSSQVMSHWLQVTLWLLLTQRYAENMMSLRAAAQALRPQALAAQPSP